MKTTKIFLSIALVALTTSLFGRINEPNADCNCCPNDVIIEQEMNIEGWMIEPFEASIDNDLLLEEWMTSPFDTSEESLVEEWMAVAW